MLVKLAEAIGRLVLAGRELTRLAGFTARVTELMTVLKDLNQGRYQRTMVTNENGITRIRHFSGLCRAHRNGQRLTGSSLQVTVKRRRGHR